MRSIGIDWNQLECIGNQLRSHGISLNQLKSILKQLKSMGINGNRIRPIENHEGLKELIGIHQNQ